MAELNEALEGYEATITKDLGKKINLNPVRIAFNGLAQRVEAFHENLAEGTPDPSAVNEALLGLSRILVHLGYAEGPRYEHDPATPAAPLPKLARVPELEPLREAESDRFPFVMTDVRRQMNKVIEGLWEASRLLDDLAGVAGGK